MKKTLTVLALLLGAQISYGEWWSHAVSGHWTTSTADEVDARTGAATYTTYDILGTGTITTMWMKNGDTATVAKNQYSGANSSVTITSLIVAPATGDEGNGTASLVIDNAQKLTLNGLTGSLSNVTVNGELTLGENAKGINNFTLDADGIIKGTYNLGSAPGDVTFTLSDTDAITSQLATGKNYQKALTSGAIWNVENANSYTLNVDGYEGSQLLYYVGDKYYSTWVANPNGGSVSNEVTLQDDSAYIIANLRNNKTGVLNFAALITAPAPVEPGDNVPEPTTATLSLLALAGLAARRRRR